jgi:hypothetical protein
MPEEFAGTGFFMYFLAPRGFIADDHPFCITAAILAKVHAIITKA